MPGIDPRRACLILGAILFATLLVRSAWVCDDAFITLRTVDNVLAGHGLRWNPSERVQAYTHPLWMGLLTLAMGLWHDPYFATIGLGLAVSLAAVLVLTLTASRRLETRLFVLAALASSKAFVDYSTSGLENPLAHLLLAALVVVVGVRARGPARLEPHRPTLAALIVSLVFLTRMDLCLIVLPGLVLVSASSPRRSLRPLALGLAPIALWEVFSLVYYGFPFPNTAYAKLGAGIPAGELAVQGLVYLLRTTLVDPVTPAIIAAGLLLGALSPRPGPRALAAGIALHVAYVVAIGGDFMLGRFLTAPLVVALAIVAGAATGRGRTAWIPLTLVLVATAGAPVSPLLGRLDAPASSTDGIADERAQYRKVTGLAEVDRNTAGRRPAPAHDWAADGYALRGREKVAVRKTIGFCGFNAGPRVHVVDVFGLADPLLARLPARHAPRWRIGHFERALPAGYVTGLLTDGNLLEDPQLREYYGHLCAVVRGPLFSLDRFAEIVRFNLGRHGHLVDRDRWRFEGSRAVALATLADRKPEGGSLTAPGAVPFGAPGLRIDLDAARAPAFLDLSLDGLGTFGLIYLKGGQEVARQTVGPAARAGLSLYYVEVPDRVRQACPDRLRVVPLDQEKGTLGHLRVER